MARCNFCKRSFESSQGVIAHLRACRVYKSTHTSPSSPPHTARPPITADRRTWLTHWKERAVNTLPTGTPVGVKVEARRAVETALAAYGPEDHDSEIQDLVTMVVREMTEQLTEETRTQERETRKQQLMQSVDLWIDDITLTHFPSDLVGARRSPQRRAVLATLRKQIRQTLAAELTGDEPIECVVSRIQDELATWAVEQNPHVDRRTLLRRLAPWVVTTVAGGIAAASWSPELKTTMRKGAQVLRERLIPYAPVARSLARSTVQILEQWVTEQAMQAQARKAQKEQDAHKQADQEKEKAS